VAFFPQIGWRIETHPGAAIVQIGLRDWPCGGGSYWIDAFVLYAKGWTRMTNYGFGMLSCKMDVGGWGKD
jgi:hypothetical protein